MNIFTSLLFSLSLIDRLEGLGWIRCTVLELHLSARDHPLKTNEKSKIVKIVFEF